MIKSRWNKYIGVATTAIEKPNQIELFVYCPELLPFITGSLTKNQDTTSTVKVKDVYGNVIEKTITFSKVVKAEYLGIDTNRSVPDIHIGEQIYLHRYANQKKFYWTPLGRDDKLRKTEHIRYSVANKKKKLDPLTDDNTYYIELDTKYNKHVKIATSDSNGEKFKYLIHINANPDDSFIKIEDNDKNIIHMYSNIPKIILENKSKSKVELVKDVINIQSPKEINIKSKTINIISDNVTNMGSSDLNINMQKISTSSSSITTKAADVSETYTKHNLVSALLNITAGGGEIMVSTIGHMSHGHMVGTSRTSNSVT